MAISCRATSTPVSGILRRRVAECGGWLSVVRSALKGLSLHWTSRSRLTSCLGFSAVTLPFAAVPLVPENYMWPCGGRRGRGAKCLGAARPMWATVFALGAEEQSRASRC